MDSSILKRAEKFLKEKSRRRQWTVTVSALGVIVVVATALMLMAPARAMTETYCGFEEHVHETECYEEVLICGYGEEAGELTAVTEESGEGSAETGEKSEEPSSVVEKMAVHVHGESCYQETRTLICGLEEYEGHTHADECYTVVMGEMLICGMEASEEHAHTEECYAEVPQKILSCGQEASEEHTHTEQCYTELKDLTCAEEESAGHTHTPDCYKVDSVLICDRETEEAESTVEAEEKAENESSEPAAEGAEKEEAGKPEDEAHVHTEDCYEVRPVCGLEEHKHTDECRVKPDFYCADEVHKHTENCYNEEGYAECGYADFVIHTHGSECSSSKDNSICPFAEVEEHIHTEECYEKKTEDGEPELICGKREIVAHIHEGDCFDEQGRLVCEEWEILEHVHEDKCFDKPQEQPEVMTEQTFEGEGFIVRVVYGEKADIPKKAVLFAEQITEESDAEHYAQRVAEYEELAGEQGAPMQALLKIGFYINGREVEPREAVTVTVQLLDEYGMEEGEPVTIVHFAEEGAEQLEGSDTEEGSTTFELGSFSEIAIGFGNKENDTPFYCVKKMHKHTENCLDEEGEAVCGYADFVVHTHKEECYDGNGTLICPLEEVEDYSKLHIHEGKCFDADGYLVCEEQEVLEHAHSDECFVKPEQKEEAEMTRTFAGNGFVITATYGEKADIPAKARLTVEQITAESDPEAYAAREEMYNELTDEKDVPLRALLKIGFYMGEREIRPAQPVNITVQFVDENGENVKGSVSVVRFDGEEAELLETDDEENGSAVFSMEETAETAVGFRKMSRKIQVDESIRYENAAFRITFHIEGEVAVPEEDAETEESAPEGNDAPGDEPAGADTAESGGTVSDGEEDEAADEDVKEALSVPIENSGLDENMEFRLEELGDKSQKYETVVGYGREIGDDGKELRLQVWKYSLNYNGKELDLDDCMVTAEIVPTQMLIDAAREKIKEEASEEDSGSGTVDIPEGDSVLEIVGGNSPETPDEAPGDEEPETDGSDADASRTEDASGNGEDIVIAVMGLSVDAEIEEIQTAAVGEDDEAAAIEPINIVLRSRYLAARASGQPNPKFTVQYYANLDLLAEGGTNALAMIDTSGKKLPVNGNTTSPTGAFKYLYVDNTGEVQTVNKPTEVYSSRKFEYHKAPTINYMNALVENANYKLKEVWVLKEGKNAGSTEEADWDVHIYSKDLHFTNRSVSAESGEYVLIKDGAVIRFVYDTTKKEDTNFAAAFYDYDISTGRVHRAKPPEDPNQYVYKTAGQTFSGDNLTAEVLTWAAGLSGWDGHLYAYTKEQGINSSGNYSGSGTKLAFGNVNTGTNLGRLTWKNAKVENELNKYNNQSYLGCTFGLVTGMSDDGKILYASGINAPKLFNEGDATGKTSYNGYSLQFKRVGDTYTLSAVNGTEATNLGNFSNPTNSTGTHTDIWTNNFWPMDSAPSFGTDTHDVKFGATATFKGGEHEIRFGPITQKGTDYTFPESDDGKYHNSYFGMMYEVEFDLDKDYVGPLEYYFFGDDDMWVFLDGQLVCDIGGVHSSVGEYVNLWDYLHKHEDECYDEEGKLNCEEGITHVHTDECYKVENEKKTLTCKQNTKKLSFFYTERGASGSTCWMQFTLPSVSSLTPETTDKDYGELRIQKKVTHWDIPSGEDTIAEGKIVEDNNDEFSFTINLTDADGNNLPDDYSYVKYDKDGSEIGHDLIIWDGGEFTLKNREYIVIKFLPQGTKYTITEANKAFIIIDNTSGETEESKINYLTSINIDSKLVDGKDNLNDGKIAEGTIPKGGESFVMYENKIYRYALPETGGSGVNLYTIAGVVFLLGGAGFLYRKKFRERRA